jgi:hypothetical protein
VAGKPEPTGRNDTGPLNPRVIGKDNPFLGQSWEVKVPEGGKTDVAITVNR